MKIITTHQPDIDDPPQIQLKDHTECANNDLLTYLKEITQELSNRKVVDEDIIRYISCYSLYTDHDIQQSSKDTIVPNTTFIFHSYNQTHPIRDNKLSLIDIEYLTESKGKFYSEIKSPRLLEIYKKHMKALEKRKKQQKANQLKRKLEKAQKLLKKYESAPINA